MRQKLALAPAAFLALALGLTGCSGAADKLTYEDSPLAAYLNGGFEDMTDEDWQQQYDEEQKKTEDLVAKCMKEEGFEYIPNTSNGMMTSVMVGEEEEWKPDDREWVSKYGYGQLDYPGRKAQMAPPEEGEEYVDPNAEYVESLSQSEQDAYYATLWGDPEDQPEPDEDGNYEWDWTKSGCYGAAQHEVSGDGGMNAWQADEFKDLTDAINEFYTEMYEGDLLAELDKKWSDCMAKSDFDFAKRNDASDSIWKAQEKIWAEAEGDDFDPDLYDLDKNPALQELQKQEVKVALADLDCRVSVNYEEESLKIQFAAEEEFIQEHKAELDAFKEALEAGQK